MSVNYRQFIYLTSSVIFLGQFHAGNALSETVSGQSTLFASQKVSEKESRLQSSVLEIAQAADPNQDRFPQPLPDSELPEPEEDVPVLPPTDLTPEPISPEASEADVSVETVEVVGSTIFTPEDWAEFTAPLEGQTVTVAELNAAVAAITQLYQDEGYLTSRAILPQQEVVDGVVQIQIIEGTLEDIQIEGNQRVKTGYISRRVNLGVGTPLNVV